MKKVFKKSILIVTSFILGSIACISIGVYAYSYSATDIQYSGTTNVKQAIDDLYTKVRPDIFQFDNHGGACFYQNGDYHCFKVGEDNRSAEMEHAKALFGESNCRSAGGYVYFCKNETYEVGIIWAGGNIQIQNCLTKYKCVTTSGDDCSVSQYGCST